MTRAMCLSILAIALGTTQTEASDLNPLGFYLGGAVGQGRDTVDSLENISFVPPFQAASTTGWKAIVGARPISFLGGELEYVDFGSSSANAYLLNLSRIHADAATLYAVGYLPIPIPFLDVFGKAGLARTKTTYSGTLSCVPPALCILGVNADRTETDFAYGAGVQAKFQALAFRAEYERTDTSVGHPSLLSFGVTWTF
jgi:opacity protein-like surface antigen